MLQIWNFVFQDERTFSEEEEEKLQSSLSLADSDLELVIHTLEFILHQVLKLHTDSGELEPLRACRNNSFLFIQKLLPILKLFLAESLIINNWYQLSTFSYEFEEKFYRNFKVALNTWIN